MVIGAQQSWNPEHYLPTSFKASLVSFTKYTSYIWGQAKQIIVRRPFSREYLKYVLALCTSLKIVQACFTSQILFTNLSILSTFPNHLLSIAFLIFITTPSFIPKVFLSSLSNKVFALYPVFTSQKKYSHINQCWHQNTFVLKNYSQTHLILTQ